MKFPLLLALLVSMQQLVTHAQNSLPRQIQLDPVSYLRDYSERAHKISGDLQQKSTQALAKLERAERRLVAKIAKKDSLQAAQMAAKLELRYASFRKLLNDTSKIDPLRQLYLPLLDSATVVTRLMNFAGLTDRQQALLSSMQLDLGSLQGAMTRTNMLQSALTDRILELRSELGNMGLFRDISKLTKKVVQYKSTLQQLRSWANEPDRLLAKALTTFADLPLFKRIFERYSILSALLPPSPNLPIDPLQAGTMQVRTAVMTAVGQTSGISNLNQVVQMQGTSMQNPFQQLRDKVRGLKQDKHLDELKDNGPDRQEGKPLLKRLEIGTNFQTARSNNYFPATSDLGLSVGFRVNERSVIGMGASYKMGWGKDFRHLQLSHQGVSIRSFANARIKGSLHATGGWECHYQQPFTNFRDLPEMRTWRQSALIGVSKKMSLHNRLLKSTEVQMLVDLLAFNTAYSPIVFRVGYQFTK